MKDVADRLMYTTRLANRWSDLGEVEKAGKVLSETLPIANQDKQGTGILRGFFAAALARFDLPAALDIANEFSGRDKDRILGLMAIRLAAINPSESERLWYDSHRLAGSPYRENLECCWRLAASDPVRARRIADVAAREGNPDYYLILAHGLAPRDKAAARDALQRGLECVNQYQDDPKSNRKLTSFFGFALQLIDQIDPASTAEILWDCLASRPALTNSMTEMGAPSAFLIWLVGHYDQNLAKVLFDPVRARMKFAEDRDLAQMSVEFVAWTLLDPAGAIAAVERLPVNLDRINQTNKARIFVAAMLLHRKRWTLPLFNSPLAFLPGY